MVCSVFNGKSKKPDENELAGVLGQAHSLGTELKQLIAEQHKLLEEEWAHSGEPHGWSPRLNRRSGRFCT
jgi:hypothetical protein